MNPNVTAKLTAPDGLATHLKALRQDAGLSGVALAGTLGWQQSKVSRIEGGQQMPTEGDVQAWAEAAGAAPERVEDLLERRAEATTEQQTWRRRTRRGLAAVQQDYNELVARTTVTRMFETAVVPGLLQTWDYAYWVAVDSIRLHGDPKGRGPEAPADAKVARAKHLDDPAKRFEFIIAEPALGWLACPPEVMVDQLSAIELASRRSNVRLGVVPLRRRIAGWPQNSFALYDDVARVEGFVAEDEYTGDVAKKYRQIFDELWGDAVEGEEARQLIVAAADALRG